MTVELRLGFILSTVSPDADIDLTWLTGRMNDVIGEWLSDEGIQVLGGDDEYYDEERQEWTPC